MAMTTPPAVGQGAPGLGACRRAGQTVEMPSALSAVSFRDATLSDVTAVVSLVQSAYRGDASRAGWTTEADLLGGIRTDAAAVRAVISASRSVVMLACRPKTAERPAGSGHLDADAAGALLACCQVRDEGGGRGYFGLFAVRPDRQGAGIGRAVLAEVEQRVAAEWQCRLLRMTVIRQRADLIAWYQRLGFVLTGETTPFPYGDERFGQPKRPGLEFAELAKALG
jgi:ribosomal protein S18 acetylase RimI-like enzyme